MYYVNIVAPDTCVINYPVQFSGESNVPSPVLRWNFGDSSPISTGLLVSHSYDTPDTYTVMVQASGSAPSGTYIYDDFSGNHYDEWWNDDFTSTHKLKEYPPDSGNYVAVREDSDWRWLLPSGASICGDFDLQWQIVFGADNNDNISVHLALYNTDGTSGLCDLQWYNYINWSWPIGSNQASAASPFSPYGSLWLRLERVDSTITAYYKTDSEWTALANPLTYSGCVIIKEDGASRHGIGEFHFDADSGLPYSFSEVILASGAFDININDIISGFAYGVGYIHGGISFYYPPTPPPPTCSGLLKKGMKPMLTNKERYPYKIPYDLIVSKVDFLQNGRLSYLSGIPIELWMNYSGEWNKVEDGSTDRYGSCYITHTTSGIPNITNCLGVVKATYEGGYYVSNLMRYNFYSGNAIPEDLVYIIDAAATGTVPDRIAHDIFDGSGRLNFFDRMYYV